MEFEELQFDPVKESRDRYFVEYRPPFDRDWFASLHVVVVEPMNAHEVADCMESEAAGWLARYPVPLMVSAFDDAGELLDLSAARACDCLIAYVDPGAANARLVWRLLSTEEAPSGALDQETLLRLYSDVPVTRSSSEKRANEFRVFARGVRTGRRLMVAWLLVWLVAIPLAWAVLQWAGPGWLATLVLVFCVYKALMQTLRLLGVRRPSAREQEAQEKQGQMEHCFEQCAQNPDAFKRLEIENFEREARARTRDEASELAAAVRKNGV